MSNANTNRPLTLVPTVHINGTSRDALVEQNESARNAVRVAINALEAAQPNARDYYPQGDGAFRAAMAQHTERLTLLGGILEGLNEISYALCE
jgi:hypothetical protein